MLPMVTIYSGHRQRPLVCLKTESQSMTEIAQPNWLSNDGWYWRPFRHSLHCGWLHRLHVSSSLDSDYNSHQLLWTEYGRQNCSSLVV